MVAKKNRKILVAMMDEFGPNNLKASKMPNLKQMIKEGIHKNSQCLYADYEQQ